MNFFGENDLKTKPSVQFYDLLTSDFPNKSPLDSSIISEPNDILFEPKRGTRGTSPRKLS